MKEQTNNNLNELQTIYLLTLFEHALFEEAYYLLKTFYLALRYNEEVFSIISLILEDNS